MLFNVTAVENEPAVEIEPAVLIEPFNVTAVEIELAVEIEPAALIEPAVEIELFPYYMAGSISTACSINTAGSFHKKAQFP